MNNYSVNPHKNMVHLRHITQEGKSRMIIFDNASNELSDLGYDYEEISPEFMIARLRSAANTLAEMVMERNSERK